MSKLSSSQRVVYTLCACLLTLALATAALTRGQASPPAFSCGYATSLAGRTPAQVHNAQLAAAALNGTVVPPNAIFSFNAVVKGWSQDDGYEKAPVSYDGELVRAYGGGVCQASTTLYNAALLAGLPIVERHPHAFHPAYAVPGRDAAVAYPGVDLRLRNNLPVPLHIVASASSDRLQVRLEAVVAPAEQVRLEERVCEVQPPQRIIRRLNAHGYSVRRYRRSPGLTGCRAVVWRSFWRHGHEVNREEVSDDTYAAMNRIITVEE